jgi:hypothetical protein
MCSAREKLLATRVAQVQLQELQPAALVCGTRAWVAMLAMQPAANTTCFQNRVSSSTTSQHTLNIEFEHTLHAQAGAACCKGSPNCFCNSCVICSLPTDAGYNH